MILGRNPAYVWEQLRALGHDAQTVRNTKAGWEVVLNSGDQAAADAALADVIAAGPTQAERLQDAARNHSVNPTQAALAAVVVARVDGTAPPSWALGVLRRLVANINQELGQ